MQYAFVNGIKSLPEKGKTGICMGCSQEVVSKCGSIKVHHWAHKRTEDCDTWSEPETEWHREWKNKFPENYREVTFKDANTNEYHRADIHTKDGVTIEFQNSPLSVEEFNQRNRFYKKLIWVVNGLKFKNNFSLKQHIPNPSDALLNNFEMSEMLYFKKADVLDLGISEPRLLQVYGLNSPELKGLELSDIHHAFTWNNKRKGWLQSNALVFLDFGQDFLCWLRKREQILEPFWYIQIVKKTDFISKYSQ
ncbi:MAG: competence protein CoiA family protein [Bacteroidia bacterium]